MYRHVLLIGLNFHVARLLSRMGILDKIKETARFPTRLEAMETAVALTSGSVTGTN